MAQFYYLISSLPMLELDEVPNVNSTGFLELCADFVSPVQSEILAGLSLVPNKDDDSFPEWNRWETMLRNRLALHREAFVKGASNFTREEKDYFAEVEKIVQDAYLKDNPLEREDFLDRMRWARLEDLEVGHEFDFMKLCTYRLKLLLCEKRRNRDKEHGSSNYDRIVSDIYGDKAEPLELEA